MRQIIKTSTDNIISTVNQNFTELTNDIVSLKAQITTFTHPVFIEDSIGTITLSKEIVIRLLQIGESYRYACTHTTNVIVLFEITYYINSNSLHISLTSDELIYEEHH